MDDRAEQIEDALRAVQAHFARIEPKIDDLAAFVKYGVPNLATKSDLAKIQTEMASLATKAELAKIQTEMGNLATKAELAKIQSDLGNLATKPELAKVQSDLAKVQSDVGRIQVELGTLATRSELTKLQSEFMIELAKRPTRRQSVLDIAWIVGIVTAAATFGGRLVP
jgi:hypothetical protein